MPEPIELTGITWRHSRGLVPLVATAQRFNDERPEVSIEWRTRSLKDFGDFPIERLVERFDLLIIDHPFAGYASAHDVLVPLDEHLPEVFVRDQARNSVGASHASYEMGGHLWALAVDAATPVSGWRVDLLERADADPPATWDELLALARRGLVAVSAAPVDLLMHLYMLALVQGEEPGLSGEKLLSDRVGLRALDLVRELIAATSTANLDRNPIRTWEAIARGESVAYCAFAYGYANYGRRDYVQRPLRFGGLVDLDGVRLRSTLGGAGLAISSRCTGDRLAAALAYAAFVAAPETQTGLFATHGGQPGHRRAWLDPIVNEMTNDFFIDTLQTLDDAWLRPRHRGYIPFQDHAGGLIRDHVHGEASASSTLAALNDRYRASFRDA